MTRPHPVVLHVQADSCTPVISGHARQRCAEMGLSTKIAKRTWQCRTLTRPDPQGHPDRVFVSSTAHPEVSLIVNVVAGEKPRVVTVLWHSYTPFVRPTQPERISA